MAATEADLMARLDELGIATTTKRHPPVYTVEEAKALRGELDGAHTKNLFFKDKKGQLWLVVCLEDRSLDLKQLDKLIGAARLSFGRAELLVEVLGIEPGAVTPFSLINDRDQRVKVVLDAAMMAMDPLNFHPLDNAATTQIAAADLETFVRACGHEPQILDLGPATRA